jgi:hypothetical protein
VQKTFLKKYYKKDLQKMEKSENSLFHFLL